MRDALDAIRGELERRESAARRHRESFPGVAVIVDELAAVFGPVKVRWAEEGGREIGTRIPWGSA